MHHHGRETSTITVEEIGLFTSRFLDELSRRRLSLGKGEEDEGESAQKNVVSVMCRH